MLPVAGHRAAVLGFAVVLGCSSPPPEPAPEPATAAPAGTPTAPTREPLLLVDVAAKAAEGSADFVADWSFDLVDRPEWSLHTHVIPAGQLIPVHRHRDNDELVFVAGGTAEGLAWWAADGVQEDRSTHRMGSVFGATRGAAHGVRNRGPELLATVVLQQPRFGQNWYLERADVDSATPPWFWPNTTNAGPVAGPSPSLGDPPTSVGFDGWTLGWRSMGPREPREADTIYFVAAGEGTLRFEDKALPLTPGVVAVVPPTLAHELSGTARVFEVEIPR